MSSEHVVPSNKSTMMQALKYTAKNMPSKLTTFSAAGLLFQLQPTFPKTP